MSYLNFTTQQLQGGGKYSTKTKIGNWYEDTVQEEIKFKDYIKKKETNNFLVSKKEDKFSSSLKKSELLPFSEGKLTTNNYFMIRNEKNKGFLVMDTDDKSPSYQEAFAVTTNPLMNFPCPRSMFGIEKYDKSNQDPVIYYGEKICLYSHENIWSNKLYMFSSLVTPQSYSRFSRNQEINMNSERSYSSAWIIEYIDPSLRFSMEGRPVSISEPFILRHCATARLLASDFVDYFNDYGHEYEVCGFNYMSNNKYQTLISEKDGRLKIDTSTKSEQYQNIWSIIDSI